MRLLLAVLLLALAAPTSALAELYSTQSSGRVTSLALLDDGTPTWAEVRGDGSAVAIDPRQGPDRPIATVPAPGGGWLEPVVEAADGDIAFAVANWSCYPTSCRYDPTLYRTAVLAGPRGRRLVPIGANTTDATEVEVGGGHVGLGLLLGDLRTGARRDAPYSTSGVRLAGGREARRDGVDAPIVVREIASGRELFRVTDRASIPVALASDGSLLLQGPGGWSVATPAAPTPRLVPVPSPGYRTPMLFGTGWIGVRSGTVLTIYDHAGTALGSVPLDAADAPVAFDGTRVATAAARCGRTFVTVWRFRDAPPRVPAGACGTPAIVRARVLPRAFTIDLACPATRELGCRTAITMTARVGRGEARSASRVVALGPGERRTTTLPVTDELVQDLPGGRTAELRITRGKQALKVRRVRVGATS